MILLKCKRGFKDFDTLKSLTSYNQEGAKNHGIS
jgi:hypothetical protein